MKDWFFTRCKKSGCAVFRVRNPKRIPVVMAKGSHLFPYRTQKLSLSAPMVLGWRRPGRVGRCRIPNEKAQQMLGFFLYRKRNSPHICGGLFLFLSDNLLSQGTSAKYMYVLCQVSPSPPPVAEGEERDERPSSTIGYESLQEAKLSAKASLKPFSAHVQHGAWLVPEPDAPSGETGSASGIIRCTHGARLCELPGSASPYVPPNVNSAPRLQECAID